MRIHKKGISREQLQLLPASIEEYVGKDNAVRVIDAYVESLDMVKLGFDKAEIADVGRDPYDPKDLLKLYIYGYFNKVRSSRKLEAETHKNLEVMWLLRDLRPDDRTISGFRKSNSKSIKGVFVEFRILCQNLQLFGSETVAIDGTKIKASNSKKRNFTRERLKERIKAIEEDVEKYLTELADADLKEVKLKKSDVGEIRAKIEQLDERLSEYRQLYSEMEESGAKQVSLTDEDSRSMRMAKGATEVAYNVQVSVDSKNKMIVEYEATNESNDMGELHGMSVKSREALGVDSIEVLADSGYTNPSEIKKCDDDKITTYVPLRKVGYQTKDSVPTEEYAIDKFKYNKDKDVYTCPQGEELVVISKLKNKDDVLEQKRYGTKACDSCLVRSNCTTNKQGRIITRSELHDTMDSLANRLADNPTKTSIRGQICEHVFGTIKTVLGLDHFIVRGEQMVEAEFGLAALSFNLKRAINILSVPILIKFIQEFT